MMNKITCLLLAIMLISPFASAQSITDEIPLEIIVEALEDDSFVLPEPYVDVEVQPALSDIADTANLRGLDRINGTTQDIELSVGETITYERLEISLLACRYPQGDINADAFAQLIIRDIREDEPKFIGWMFASSPALSALDHPRYDVWVLSCKSS